MGLVVIQDMPALRPLQSQTGSDCSTSTVLPDAQQQEEFSRQLEVMIEQLKSHPSISTWVSLLAPVSTVRAFAKCPLGDLQRGLGSNSRLPP